MRSGRVSDAVAADWLADLQSRTTHLSLMVSDPFLAVDPLTCEPGGGVYARAAVDWTISGRLLRNTNVLVWVGLPSPTTIVAIAGFDAAFNGNMTFSSPVTPALAYPAGGGLSIGVNDFFVGLDA